MAKPEIYAQVEVSLAKGPAYSIVVCRDGLQDPAFMARYAKAQHALIVTNETIAPLYLSQVQKALARCDVVVLPDGEQFKNQQSLLSIYECLIKNKHHRDTTVFALGGGVIGDIAGFAAATYMRGVNLVHLPTSLLAQVDASIGGKTAINHALGKNLIGSFYQPQAVIVDLSTLSSLPRREFRSGLAEMIKYALLVGGQFLEQLTHALRQGLSAKSDALVNLIVQCCQIKAKYVMMDEKEAGQRALLNLGHTLAHALETYTNYQHWLHGEAVAIGLYYASILSQHLGVLDSGTVTLVKDLLRRAGLPYQIPASIDLKKLRALMDSDKKMRNNHLRFVLMRAAGDCYLDELTADHSIHQALLSAVKGE